MSDRLKWIKMIVDEWGALEDDQVVVGDDEGALARQRYLVVEHGRDASRRWYNAFDDLEETLAYAVGIVTEDEWGFTAAYDLDTGQKLGLRFHGEVAWKEAIESGDE